MGGAHPHGRNGIMWRDAVGKEVGLFFGADEPCFEFDRRPFEHP